MTYKIAGTIALLASALVVETVHAQQRAPRPPRPGMAVPDSARDRMPTRRVERNPGHPAAAVLRMREQLQLDDAQVQRLENLRQNALPRVSESALMRARADLLDATRGDGNPDAARAALERINRIHVDQQVARIRARKDARDVLTAQQKTQLEQMERRVVDRRNDRIGPNGRANVRPSRPGQPRGMQGMRPRMDDGPGGPARRGFQGPPPARRRGLQGQPPTQRRGPEADSRPDRSSRSPETPSPSAPSSAPVDRNGR